MNAPASSAEIQSLPAKQAILVDALRPFLAEDALLWQPEDTIPYALDPVESTAPVAAVLELRAGLTAELGITAGDTVSWK